MFRHVTSFEQVFGRVRLLRAGLAIRHPTWRRVAYILVILPLLTQSSVEAMMPSLSSMPVRPAGEQAQWNSLIGPADPRNASRNLGPLGGATTRVSLASDGAQGNGKSDLPAVSADGRYVVFSSEASNLVSNDYNNVYDVFVHDRETRQTTRVSVSSSGGQGNGPSFEASISADGRYVAFTSYASDLVSGDTNNAGDVLVHDRQTDQTTRVSIASNGAQGNELSIKPAISADGRYVAFESWASNLVTGDTNGQEDVFVHDRQTGQTVRVSVASDGMQGNDESDLPAISADGRYVAFGSNASNLVSGDNNNVCDTNNDGVYTDNCPDIFVRDRDADGDGIFDEPGQVSTVLISVASDGTQENGWVAVSSLSSDGRYVAFESLADNLVSGDTNGVWDIFVHDRQTGVTNRVSVTSDGAQGNAASQYPSLSADGRYVAFVSQASLVSDDTNGMSDIYLHDRQTRQTIRVSIASDGTPGNDNSKGAALSADGRFVAFSSSSDNLVSGDTNGMEDVFLHDTVATVPPTNTPTYTPTLGGPSATPTHTPTDTPTPTPTPSGGPSVTPTHTPTSTQSPTRTPTPLPTATRTPTPTLTPSRTPTPTTIAPTYTISGRVTYPNGTPLPDVYISNIAAGRITTTDSNGNYTLSGLTASTYTIMPSLIGFTFSPSSRVVVVPPNAAGQNFTAIPFPTVSIEYMEVTQSVQCLVAADCWNNQLVPLIRGKRTIVRLYLKSSGVDVSGVWATLSVTLDGQYLGSIDSNNKVTAKSSGSDRDRLSETLYFELLGDWFTNGTRLGLTPTIQCDNCVPALSGPRIFTLEPSAVPLIRLKPVRAKFLGFLFRPNVNRGLGAARVAESAYPSPHFDLNTLSSMDFTECNLSSGVGCETRLLVALYQLLVNDELPPQAHIYGLVNPIVVSTGGHGGVAWDYGNVAWGQVGGPNTRAADFQILAHEVAHTYGALHVWGCGEKPKHSYLDYPWDDGHIGNGLTGAYGFDTSTLSIFKNTTHDFMTYCQYTFFWNGSPWISDYVYARLREGIRSASSSTLVSQPNQVWSVGQEFVIVSGLISSTNTVELFPSYLLPDRGDYVTPEDGPYAIELRDSSGNLLASQQFTPSLTSEGGDWRHFVKVLPWSTAVATIQVIETDTSLILAEQLVSANSPNVSITWPNGGETLSGEVTLTWNASDPDRDGLTYIVQYSADNGSTWTTLASPLTEATLSIDTEQLTGSSVGLFRVIATDGVNTAQDDSDGTFVVPTKPPTVEILAPLDGTTYLVGDVTVLEGSAYDIEDGILEESALAWTSSRDGDLGTGSIVLATLSLGQHIITLTATDSDGKVTTDSLNVFVDCCNAAPTVDAGGPYEVDEGGSIVLAAVGSDRDGDPLTYAWELDNNGSFETPGQSVTFSVAELDGPSIHTTAVQVTDSGGLTATDQAIVSILNVAPTVGAINVPLEPPVNTAIDTSVNFTDPGMLDTHTAVWDWGDGTTSAGVVSESNGSGFVSGEHTYDAAGIYKVKVTVTDDDGGVGESTFQYVVISFVDLDIIPHSKQNRILIHRKHGLIGLIQVAILSTSDFDAPSMVDRTSLTFGRTGDEESLIFCFDHAKDVNRDGLKDLICVFRGRLTGFQVGDTRGILKGMTIDGARFEGSDSVRIVISGEHDEKEEK